MFIGAGAGTGALTLGRSGTSNNASFFSTVFFPASTTGICFADKKNLKIYVSYWYRYR